MVLIGSRALREAPPRPIRYRGYIRIPIFVWASTFLVAFFISLDSLDPWLTFSCIAVVPLLAAVIWRIGEPPVAFAALTAQWLQISAGTFRATISGVSLSDLWQTPGANYASSLSLGGLLVLALGIRFANMNRAPMNIGALHAEIRNYRYSRIVAAYCLAQAANFFLQGVIWSFPGLTQALLAASQLRWLFYFILVVATLVQKRGYGYLAAATAFEILLGFSSFFADFKTVFFVLIVSYLMVQVRISTKMVVSLGVLAGALFYMAVIWSSVKTDYRLYQNQGTGAQVSMGGALDNLEALAALIGKVDAERFSIGLDKLAQRVEYTQFFSRVTDNVPMYVPYDDGGIWEAAVLHVITPRILFPDKASLSGDIENTMRYTGLTFGGGGNETEIPLGYMAESYIDFGPVGMFIPIFLLGLMLGYEYRYFATRSFYLMFSYGLTPVVFGTVIAYEETAVKILGGNLIVFIVAYGAVKFAVPSIDLWLKAYRRAG
jgi:hypothetical protein